MSVVRIKVLSLGSGDLYDQDLWVMAYDPDDGVVWPTFTPDPDEALLFAGMKEAMERWRAVDPGQPTRSDGKPNRPLTAFTVEFEHVRTEASPG